MFRKFVAAMVVVIFALGGVFADEIKGQFVKFADGKLTLKVGDADKDFTIPSDLKTKRKGKDGEFKEFPVTDMLTKMNDSKFKPTIVLTTDKDKVTDLKLEFKKKNSK